MFTFSPQVEGYDQLCFPLVSDVITLTIKNWPISAGNQRFLENPLTIFQMVMRYIRLLTLPGIIQLNLLSCFHS